MDYFRFKTANELSDLHNMAFASTSKATKTTFYQSMKRMERLYEVPMPEIQLRFIDEKDDFLKLLDESKYSQNTKLTTLTNILKLLKIIDAPLITYNSWLETLKTMTDARQKKDKEVLKSKLKVLMNFNDIRDQVNKSADKYMQESIDYDEFENFLILSLFTLQIPVRVSNFVGLKVVDDEAFTNEKDNFLLVDGEQYKFIFNKYRTSHILGKKEIYVHDENLQFLIDKWLSEYNTDSNNFLTISEDNKRPMNGRQIQDALEQSTTKLFGSKLSIDNIRSSYMKMIIDLDPEFSQKLDIANILGYSSTDQLETLEDLSSSS